MTETIDAPRAQSPPRRGPRLPDVPGPWDTLRAAWRRLRRMSTALVLLFLLAAASVVATLVPQTPVTPAVVEQWREGSAGPGRAAARLLEALGLFDVFGSWWFMTLTLLLFTSLTGCLLPRWRAFARVARRPPAPGRDLERLDHHEVVATPLPPAQALAAAERVLARHRFRRRRVDGPDGGGQLAAHRGHWREGGSLVFHTAFYLVLLGAVIGKAFGFTGQVGVVEGGAFADTRIAYDYVEPGRWWDLADHRGFLVTLDDFDVRYHEDFTPAEFVSRVTVSEGGRPVRRADVRVNHPLRHDGMAIYQSDFGLAPRVVVRAGEQVLLDEQVFLGPVAGQNSWSGTAKVRFDDPQRQLALDLLLVPDARLDGDGNPVVGPDPRPRNPVMVASLYFGALGLEQPRPASRFDRGDGPVATAMLRPGGDAELVPGELSVAFPELGYWSGFQVSHQPGRGILLAGGLLLLVGLVPSLYSYRRRLWVEARPDGRGSRVTVAGAALQRKAAFDDEYAALSAALRAALRARTLSAAPRSALASPTRRPAPE